jgi:hypothetical protein
MNEPGRITQDQNAPTDYLETISQSNPSTPDVPEDSPTSGYDAGLDDEQLDEGQIEEMADVPAAGEVLEDNESEYSRMEIPMTDLPDAPREDPVHSPELADMNSPGEVDIEDLDEDAARDAIPPDARLDKVEE